MLTELFYTIAVVMTVSILHWRPLVDVSRVVVRRVGPVQTVSTRTVKAQDAMNVTWEIRAAANPAHLMSTPQIARHKHGILRATHAKAVPKADTKIRARAIQVSRRGNRRATSVKMASGAKIPR
jgi:hypothetical protein